MVEQRKSILVTGGAGFIGLHLVNALVRKGYDVTVIDRFEQMQRRMYPEVRFFTGNICFEEDMAGIFRDVGPDVVIHLAAYTSVPQSMIYPFYDEATNVAGTLSVLDACRHSGVERVIFTSSCAVYGNHIDYPATEIHRVRPQSVYGVSKLAGEHYVRLYSDMYGLKHKILRLGNVYGAHALEGVIPNFIHRMLADESPTINGDGTQTRDYIYIDDVVSALIGAIGATGDDDTFNVGTGIGTSVIDVFKAVSDVFESTVMPLFAPPRIGDIDHVSLDPAKYIATFKPAPFTTLRDGIKKMQLERMKGEISHA